MEPQQKCHKRASGWGGDGAPILMLRSARYVVIPGRSARPIHVQVPVNPAKYLHVYPVDENAVQGAAEAVYKFKTQSVIETLLILYTNTGDDDIALTIGEIVAEASMCSIGEKVKPEINSVTKKGGVHRTAELWKKLKLNANTVVPESLKPELYNLIDTYSDVFADENNTIGNTSWVKFKIDLKENALPVKQKVCPLAPPLEK